MTRINGSGDINKIKADGNQPTSNQPKADKPTGNKIVAKAASGKAGAHPVSSTANQSAINRFGADKLRALANGMKAEQLGSGTMEALSGLENNEEFLQLLAEADPAQAEAILSQQWDATEAQAPEASTQGLYAALGLND